MSAIIRMGSKQMTVNEGDRIRVEKLGNQVGESVKIESVLAVIRGGDAVYGKPFVEGASIEAKVVSHGRHKKVISFRYFPKKRIRVTRGHRQWYTELEIDKIVTA
jgi:large subunit ribosomal protein L21